MKPSKKCDDLTKAIKILHSHGYVIAFWHIGDVKEIRPDLTDKQAMQVLDDCAQNDDARIRVCWDTLKCSAEKLFPSPTKEAA